MLILIVMHKQAVLEAMSLVELMDLLHPDYCIAKTVLPEPDKRYIIDHVYALLRDVNPKQYDLEEWETFGIDFDVHALVEVDHVYGATARECLLTFFKDNPEMIYNES